MKKQWKWVIGIVLFLIVALIASTAISAEMHFRARNEAAKNGSEFLAALGTHDYKKAHTMLTISQQKVLSVSTMKIAEQQTEKTYGQPTGKAAVDEYHVNPVSTSATILYDSVYQNEPHLVLVTLTHTDNGWQVEKYQYDYSPA